MEAACADIVARAGRLAVWVNNAGVLHTGPAWEQDAATRDFMLDVNGRGVVNGTVAAIDAMRHTGGGHIVTTVSLAGITAVTGEAVYAASKHAAIGFSLSTLGDLRQAGIHDIDISCLCPDGIWTPMLHDELDDPGSAVSFSGRLLQPGEVARVFERILDRPRPVTVFPWWREPLLRVGDILPRAFLALVPLLVVQGRRVQPRMLRERDGAARPGWTTSPAPAVP